MKKGIIAAVIVIVAVGSVVFVLGNKKKDDSANSTTNSTTTTPTTPPATPTTQTSSNTAVSIKNFAFSPTSVTVKKGTTVTWINDDSAAHTVTGDAGGPASGTLASGDSYSFKFDTTGTFAYHCKFHSNMTATVVVTE